MFGVFYLSLGVLGVIVGNAAVDRMWHVGPLHLTTGDHLFHIVLGSIFLVSAAPRTVLAREMAEVD